MQPSSKISLSLFEIELLQLLELGPMTLDELRKINPRYMGALGKLKSRGFIRFVRLPNKDVRVFAKHSLFEDW